MSDTPTPAPQRSGIGQGVEALLGLVSVALIGYAWSLEANSEVRRLIGFYDWGFCIYFFALFVRRFRDAEDNSFADELQMATMEQLLVKDCVALERLDVCYSRPPAPLPGTMAFLCSIGSQQQGKYVQSVVLENGANVRDVLLEKRGLCFVCGGHGMADGVRSAMQKVLGGEERLFELVREGRFIQESWG